MDRAFASNMSWRRVPARTRDGRRIVLHIHGPRERPDLTRYAPMLAPVIESLKQRSRYSEAELMAAVISACFAIGLRSPEGDFGDGLASSGGQTADGTDISISEPGTIVDLAEGEEINAFSPGRPNSEFGPFIDAVAREVGAGVGLPYEMLVQQFNSSYSASRAAMEVAWQGFRTDRRAHVSQFCQPIYEEVITEAVARGLLEAPGFFSDPLRRRAWLGATWMGPARPTLDPVKDANSDRLYLEMGATSLTRISAERFGQDYRTVKRRRLQDGSAEAAAALRSPHVEIAESEYDAD